MRKRAALFAVMCAMIPVSYQSGAIFQRNTAKGGFAMYNFDTTPRDLVDRKTFAEIVKLIPPKATVSASDNLVPQISNRPVAYTLRFSIFDAEYVLFFSDPSRIDSQERSKGDRRAAGGRVRCRRRETALRGRQARLLDRAERPGAVYLGLSHAAAPGRPSLIGWPLPA